MYCPPGDVMPVMPWDQVQTVPVATYETENKRHSVASKY
jgi:hypothetical protein